MIRWTALALVMLPTGVWAVGGASDTAPTQTNTTKTCTTGLVWDANSQSCVAPKDSRLDDDARFEAVREFAYFGQIDAAQRVLAAMSDQTAPRVQTYWGFTYGKSGDLDRALTHYGQALAADPDNLLARSYMGQALVEAGDVAGARVQLAQIAARGGSETWAARALRDALVTGQGYSY